MNENSLNAEGKTDEVCDKAKPLGKPLLIYYDCEAANSNLFQGDIIEIAARVCEPGAIVASFEALIKSNQELGWFAIEKCGLTKDDLVDQPPFPDILFKFFRWVQNVVKKANKKTSNKYFPVLCAHGGFGFDFVMLLGNMKRHNVNKNVLRRLTNLHFADSFDFCKELQANNCKELTGVRLSMDSLFTKFCGGKPFLNRHRAMGDVNAMVDIFSKGPLKLLLKHMKCITSETMCHIYQKQYSLKEQQIILEEKMSKFDAYTKCVNMKKLLQIQLTYDGIQRIFENCCSFMDFYESMKELGIDRKASKHFACQFGGLGLKNQGTVPYCGFTKPVRSDDEDVIEEGVDMTVDLVKLNKKEDSPRPANVPEVPPDEFTITETSESWDAETDVKRSFVIQLEKPATPLSVTIDEFVSPKRRHFEHEQNSEHVQGRPRVVKDISGRKKNTNRGKNSQEDTNNNCFIVGAKLDTKTHEKDSKKEKVLEQEEQLCSQEVTNSEMCYSCCGVSVSEVHFPEERCFSPMVYLNSPTEPEYGKQHTNGIPGEDGEESTSQRSKVYPGLHGESRNTKQSTAHDRCVVFADCEQDERQKDWARETIWIGDIPIYVPVETTVAMQPEEVASCQDSPGKSETSEDLVEIANYNIEKSLPGSPTSRHTFDSNTCESSIDVISSPGSDKNYCPEPSVRGVDSERLMGSDGYSCQNQGPPNYTDINCYQFYMESRPSSTAHVPMTSSDYDCPFVPPQLLYAMDQMKVQQMIPGNIPGQYYPRQADPMYARSIPHDPYCLEAGRCECYQNEQIVPYLN